jgi:hypothetical protein
MPRQTFTVSDFSGGLNEISDSTDLQQSNQVVAAENVDFAAKGFIYSLPAGRSFDDAVANSTSLTIVDLDEGIGHGTPSNEAALIVTIGDVTSATDDLSWEDGVYNFKYTVCKDLGNGIIEEGPLQSFRDGGSDASEGANIDMSGDAIGKFTFTHSGTTHPAHMVSGYNDSLCARVYYSRQSGQGSSTQVGWIHLCDLIQDAHDATDSMFPRAVGLSGVTGLNNAIDIEEPPTSATFEMNAGYPSDVGVHDATGDLGTIKSVVTIGLIKYVATTSGSTYYIYRNLPGQPDIWPKDNWVDMTAYGECLAMHDSGNMLVYFTANNVIFFDVTRDTVVQTLYNMGVYSASVPVKCGQDIIWSTGEAESSSGDLVIASRAYIFDGKNIKEITKNRIIGVNWTQGIQFNRNSGYLRFGSGYGAPGLDYYLYNPTLDYWTGLDESGGVYTVTLPTITMGDPSMLKKVYKIIVTCQDFDGASGDGTTSEITSILTSAAFVKNEDGTDLKTSFSQGSGGNIGVYTASPSIKVRSLSIGLEIARSNPLSSVTVLYRGLRSYTD